MKDDVSEVWEDEWKKRVDESKATMMIFIFLLYCIEGNGERWKRGRVYERY